MAKNQKSAFKIFGVTIIMIFLLSCCSQGTGHDISNWFTEQSRASLYEDFQDACRKGDFARAHEILSEETGDDISNRSTEQSKASLYEDCKDACRKGDFARAHEILSKMHTQIRSYGYERYYEVFDYVYKAEIQFIMSEFSEDVCVDKITFLLNEIPIDGIKKPKGLLKHGHSESEVYLYWTVHFNRLCDQILALAINRRYKDVARNVLMQYVDNYVIIDNGYQTDKGYYEAYIDYTSDDRDAAKKKYEEAVALGIFE